MNIEMRIVRLGARRRAGMAFWGAALVALIVSHDAVYLVQMGPGEDLARTLRHAAHDYWGIASGGLLAIAGVVAAATAIRLRRLRRWADSLEGGAAPRASQAAGRAYLCRVATAWIAMTAMAAVGFAMQENVEHLRAHGHFLGLQALAGPEYPLAVPVIGIVTLLGALVAALVTGAEHALIAAIARALGSVPRAAGRLARPPLSVPPLRAAPVSAHAGRGPPSALVTA